MADLDRDAARARCEVATEGPWTVEQRGGDWEVLGPPFDDGYERGIPAHVDDAEFIAHARTDLPAALEALDAAEKERDALREVLQHAADIWSKDGQFEPGGCSDCRSIAALVSVEEGTD